MAQGNFAVDRIAGMDVFNERGIQIGNVDKVVCGGDQQTYVLVTYRGPRWPGNKQVALPLDNVALHAGRLMVSGIGEDELHAMPSVHQDGRTYTDLGRQEEVTLRRLIAPPAKTGTIPRQQ